MTTETRPFGLCKTLTILALTLLCVTSCSTLRPTVQCEIPEELTLDNTCAELWEGYQNTRAALLKCDAR